ncbi:helix-turn-helix domain-containing protein [Compostimonas suwonensis]|uniref:Excisionase family DNA binding protein n=1 Tax=Compostimonas suwonensis TaxID=1048394 RepID=A0A2M9BW62_9MICO|nr:helix-turn-helix domain-containing protein [Compostimonas suwonensis]PJJ62181.1 excisionase family DNA binding protein [Compostimonas suwonensis]
MRLLRKGPILTTRRAAEYCGLAEQTLRNLLHERRGPKAYKQGRLNAFYADDLDEWLATRISDPDAPVGKKSARATTI